MSDGIQEGEPEKKPPRAESDDGKPRRKRPRHDEEEDDDDDEEYRRKQRKIARRRTNPDEDLATGLLVPVGVSGWAMAAFFCSLFGCIPIVGAPLAIAAFALGIVALVKRRRESTYGAVTGNIRAVIGICLGGIMIAVNLLFLFMFLTERR